MTRTVDLVAADEVPPGGVVAVSASEMDLVVWRTAAGAVCVMDARCPHQWTHLAAAGSVVGDEIVCLTHHWRFDTVGCGWKLAMSGRRDRKGDTTVYESTEHHGRILAQLP